MLPKLLLLQLLGIQAQLLDSQLVDVQVEGQVIRRCPGWS